MVGALDELLAVRRLLGDAIGLVGRGDPAGLQVGMMVEVPAAALKASAFAPHVDFFSIGTNDLTQYALAAERGNSAVADVGDPFDPGVLTLVDRVCRAAHGHGESRCAASWRPTRGHPAARRAGRARAQRRAARGAAGQGARP